VCSSLWLRGYARVIRCCQPSRMFLLTWLEAVEPQSSAVSLRDWCGFQKFLQLRQLTHIARGRLEAAFKFTNAALKFGA
jgi:hypothetical protein